MQQASLFDVLSAPDPYGKPGAQFEHEGSVLLRLRLWRPLPLYGRGPVAVCVGYNPSKADDEEDDNTMRRLIDFTSRWGFGLLMMLNLDPRVSTNPGALRSMPAVGWEKNLEVLSSEARRAAASPGGRLFACWGPDKKGARVVRERAGAVLELLQRHGDVWALARTKDGSPGHPLMLPRDTEPFVYARRAA